MIHLSQIQNIHFVFIIISYKYLLKNHLKCKHKSILISTKART